MFRILGYSILFVAAMIVSVHTEINPMILFLILFIVLYWRKSFFEFIKESDLNNYRMHIFNKAKKVIDSTIELHIKALSVKYKALTVVDSYGNLNKVKWNKEKILYK